MRVRVCLYSQQRAKSPRTRIRGSRISRAESRRSVTRKTKRRRCIRQVGPQGITCATSGCQVGERPSRQRNQAQRRWLTERAHQAVAADRGRGIDCARGCGFGVGRHGQLGRLEIGPNTGLFSFFLFFLSFYFPNSFQISISTLFEFFKLI